MTEYLLSFWEVR